MIELEMPTAFKKACRNLGQGLDSLPELIEPSAPIPGMVKVALVGIDYTEAHLISRFVAELLNGGFSPDEFREFWLRTPADSYFHNGNDVIEFFKSLYDTVNKPPFVANPR